MDSIGQFVPGLADDQRSRGSVMGVTITPPCYLATSRATTADRLTAHR